jgi:isopenicillin N synthase-like dioxygenase
MAKPDPYNEENSMHWLAIDYCAPTAPREFAESLRTTGFGVIKNHPIRPEAVEALYKNWAQFFESPTKYNHLIDVATQDGYVPAEMAEIAKGYDKKDLKEMFNFYVLGKKCPAHLRPQTLALEEALSAVGATLLKWIEDYLPAEVRTGLSCPLSNMVSNHQTLFRINYYPALTGREEVGAVRAAAHTDINLITVLTAGSAKGLQVQGRNGIWVDVPCDPTTLIINAGDMLQECTHHFYPSTPHRVLNPTGEAVQKPRMSCPLFLHPFPEVVLSERHTAKSYLHERLIELGLITA